MKLQLLTVLVVVAGAFTLPRSSSVVVVGFESDESSNEPTQRNNVEGGIRSFFNFISAVIKRVGLDPLNVVERTDFKFAPPETNAVVKGFIENLKFTGLSDFRIHTLNYNHFFNRLRLDISLPEISLTVGDSGLEAFVVGTEIEGQLKGSLLIESIRLASEIHLIVGLGNISVRSMSANFSLGGIESDLTVVLQENDISDNVNQYLGEKIPFFVDDNKEDINEYFVDLITKIINSIFNSYRSLSEESHL